ncbi:MAG: hypothetical protein FJX76_20685 [Armatimonadetes bacterium]|nr:hypothetical protein [Armatimonadota bacterium]
MTRTSRASSGSGVRDKAPLIVGLLAAAAFLFTVLSWLTEDALRLFAAAFTLDQAADVSFAGFPSDLAALQAQAPDLLKALFLAYILPATLFVGLWLALAAVVGIGPLWLPSVPRWAPPVASGVLTIWVGRWLLNGQTLGPDEFAYLFQAHVLAQGHLALASPEPQDAFDCLCIINNGLWYGKYPPGYPILLAAAVLCHVPHWLNAAAGAGCLVATFVLTRDLYDRATAQVAVALLAICPFFFLNNIPMMAHPSYLFFFLVFLIFFFRGLESEDFLNPVLAGAAAGACLLIRPVDFVLPVLVCAAWAATRTRGASFIWRNMALGALPLAMCAGLLLAVNAAQTGSALVSPYVVTASDEGLGFGHHGHGWLRGLWNLMVSVGRLLVWMPPLVCELALLAWFEKSGRAALLLTLAACPVVTYFFYFTTGNTELGPRYYHAALAILPMLAARALIRSGPWMPHAYLALACVYLATVTYPNTLACAEFLSRVNNRYFVDEPAGDLLVFVRSSYPYAPDCYARNLPPVGGRTVRVVYLDAATNRRVLRQFGDRRAVVADYHPGRARFSFRDASPAELDQPLAAARNYLRCAGNRAAAGRQVREAMKRPGEHAGALLLQAELDSDAGQPAKEAARLRGALALTGESPEILMRLGILSAEAGRTREALAYFERVLRAAPEAGLAERARAWQESLGIAR